MSRLEPHAVVRHLDRLYRAAWALCGSREDAEDLVQETVTRVLARPRKLRGEEELGYLLSALRNTFLTSRRTASRRPQEVATLDDLALGDQRPAGQPEAALEAHELFAAIARLPDDFRLALIAVDVVGLSYREAAKSLGTREATITSRLHRARERVTADLTGRSGRSPEGTHPSRSLLS